MTTETPADGHVEARLYEFRQAISRRVNLFFDNVPVDELDRELLAQCLYEGLSDELDRLYEVDAEHRVARRILGTTEQADTVAAPAVDRAAVLREAADRAESLRQFERCTGPRRAAQTSENVGVLRVADSLRRLADEAQQPTPAPAEAEARRRLTPNEHDRAWHAIEGSAGEEGADPGTVLNAVLHALRIDAPTVAEEQAASPSRRATGPAEHCGHVVPTLSGDHRLIECVLRPGHSGSHADDHGMRWLMTTTRDTEQPTPAPAEETK